MALRANPFKNEGLADISCPSLPQNLILQVPSELKMYCIDTEALVFIFNGGSCYCFTIHQINNGKHMHHGFLATRAYLHDLCSTSLNYC